jgi:hypothetical protein
LGNYVFWEVFKDQFAQISGNFQQIQSYQLSFTKMVLATFWVIFSQTHLVTLSDNKKVLEIKDHT